MPGRVRKFLALDGKRRRLFLEAWCRLGHHRFSLLRKPFSELVGRLQIHREPFTQPPGAPADIATARSIGWAVTLASNHTPWDSTCLVQVLAAQRMLQGRGIPGVFYIGATTARDEGEPPGLRAHAWLKCGDSFITGEPGHEAYTVVTAFSWP